MKKNILLILSMLTIIISVNAQDFIYMRNQTKRIAAEKIDVGELETSYVLFGDKSDVRYSVLNKNISMIAYASGDIRYFERESKVIKKHSFKKNLINYHLFDLVVNNFKLSYERILPGGKIGIQIPLAIGYGGYNGISGFDDVQNDFYTGVTINFFPTGQGTVRYFMGPGIQIGTGRFTDGYYDNNGNYFNTDVKTGIFRFYVNNGIMFTPIEALSISLVGSLGIRYTDKKDHYQDKNIKTVGAFSANLSYRF